MLTSTLSEACRGVGTVSLLLVPLCQSSLAFPGCFCQHSGFEGAGWKRAAKFFVLFPLYGAELFFFADVRERKK